MIRTILCVGLIALMALAMPFRGGLAQDPAPPAAPELAPGVTVGAAVTFRNLTIFPLESAAAAEATSQERYITLDEGVAANVVTVSETGGEPGMNQSRIPPNRQNAPNRLNDPVHNDEPQVQTDEPQSTEPQTDEPQPQQTDDRYSHLRSLVEQLGNDRAPGIVAIHMELIRLQRADIEARRRQLMPQGRDITADMAELARQEAALDAIVALLNGNTPPQQLELQPQQQQQEAEQSERMQELQNAIEQRVQQMGNSQRGAEVNSLHVSNGSEHPLFLMTGELLLGGQQDRIVAVDTIIPANTTADVKVFCVEPGRWTGAARFGSGNAVVHGKLRCVAQNSKSQQAVWDEVEQANGKLGTAAGNDTGTYRDNLTAEDVAKETGEFHAWLTEHFTPSARTIGVAVAYRGQIEVIDRFGSPAVLQAMLPKLLKSYVLAAVIEARDYKAAHPDADPAAAMPTLTAANVVEFYTAVMAAPATDDDNGQSMVNSAKRECDTALGFRAERVRENDADGDRELLHENWYRK
ncbi:MAG: DUF6569 family protein [Planctomycetota bacterium]